MTYASPYKFPSHSYLPETIGLAEILLTETSYSMITPKGEILRQEFSTPARKSCGHYKPTIQELAYKEIIYGDNEVGGEKLRVISKSFNNIVRGDYIYPYRQDGFGKFNYRFHWMDSKNPSPVILQGWR